MKSPRKFLIVAFVFFSFLPLAPIQGQQSYSIAGVNDPSKVEEFLKELQGLVSRDKKEDVVKLVHFPITVKVSGKKQVLKSKEALLKNYTQAFNPNVKDAILKQKSSDLFVNWQGVMIGNGQIWFHPMPDGRLKIVAINN